MSGGLSIGHCWYSKSTGTKGFHWGVGCYIPLETKKRRVYGPWKLMLGRWFISFPFGITHPIFRGELLVSGRVAPEVVGVFGGLIKLFDRIRSFVRFFLLGSITVEALMNPVNWNISFEAGIGRLYVLVLMRPSGLLHHNIPAIPDTASKKRTWHLYFVGSTTILLWYTETDFVWNNMKFFVCIYIYVEKGSTKSAILLVYPYLSPTWNFVAIWDCLKVY